MILLVSVVKELMLQEVRKQTIYEEDEDYRRHDRALRNTSIDGDGEDVG